MGRSRGSGYRWAWVLQVKLILVISHYQYLHLEHHFFVASEPIYQGVFFESWMVWMDFVSPAWNPWFSFFQTSVHPNSIPFLLTLL